MCASIHVTRHSMHGRRHLILVLTNTWWMYLHTQQVLRILILFTNIYLNAMYSWMNSRSGSFKYRNTLWVFNCLRESNWILYNLRVGNHANNLTNAKRSTTFSSSWRKELYNVKFLLQFSSKISLKLRGSQLTKKTYSKSVWYLNEIIYYC